MRQQHSEGGLLFLHLKVSAMAVARWISNDNLAEFRPEFCGLD
jgi:hypothetical protein